MLRLVTGPFHPTLETALVDDLRSLKARDPLAGIAFVVPSDQLRRSVKRLLAVTHGLSLLNVHILSFHQLALHLELGVVRLHSCESRVQQQLCVPREGAA